MIPRIQSELRQVLRVSERSVLLCCSLYRREVITEPRDTLSHVEAVSRDPGLLLETSQSGAIAENCPPCDRCRAALRQ